jgi:hypothetical protein
MNKVAYVVLQVETVQHYEGAAAVVTSAGVYSEPHPTTIKPVVQLVLSKAEGRDFAHAARMAAMDAVSRSWSASALVDLFGQREYLREALQVWRAWRYSSGGGTRAASLRDAFVERGVVPVFRKG